MIRTILLLAAVTPSAALALIDYQCVNECSAQGYLYTYCQAQCNYDPRLQPIPQAGVAPVPPVPQLYPPPPAYLPYPPRINYQCVSDCTAQGYPWQFCQGRCSY